jgi:subtilisin family serine protease
VPNDVLDVPGLAQWLAALGGKGQDCNGHGTHVAGTVGDKTYGVAKGVRLRAVRVLNCSGSGSTSGIISALNWPAANHAAPPSRTCRSAAASRRR